MTATTAQAAEGVLTFDVVTLDDEWRRQVRASSLVLAAFEVEDEWLVRGEDRWWAPHLRNNARRGERGHR